MKKAFILLILAYTLPLLAQQTEGTFEPFSPALRPAITDDMPIWAKMTFQKNINFYAIEKAFDEDKKTKNTEGGVEDKFEAYYERWRKAYLPFVQEDGAIKLPTSREYYEHLVRENQTNKLRASPRNAPANWVNIGPKETHWLRDNNDAQPPCPWQTNILAFDIAKTDQNILFCTTETGSIFKTTDRGQNWTVCGNDVNFGSAGSAIEIHPSQPNTVYAGFNSAVFKTTDGGLTWTSLFVDAGEIHDIAIVPNSPETILVAGDKGFFRSTNGGSSWTQVYSTACFDIEINTANPSTVYLLKHNGQFVEFLKSDNAGASFTVKNIGLTVGRQGRLTVSAADPNRIYALLTTPTAPALIKSVNGGEQWEILRPTYCTGGVSDATGGQGFYDLSISASQTNANWLLFGICTVYKSTDGGVTNTNVGGYCGTYQVHPDLQEVKTVGNDAWVATDGGFTYTTDFFTTQISSFARNNGIYATDFWGYSQGWNEDIMVGGRYHNGNTAMADFYPAGKALRMGGAEAGTGYVLHGRTRAAIFSDLGDGWILPDKFDSRSGGRFPFTRYPSEDGYGFDASELVIDPQYYRHIYVGRDTALWKTTDGGSSFVRLGFFPTKVKRIEIARSNPNVLYLTTEGGLYRSTDKGVTFTRQNLPTARPSFHAELALNPTNENHLFMAFRHISGSNLGKVFRSTDGGLTWIDMTTPTLNGLQIKWVVQTGNTEGGVYIAAHENRGRVFYRDNTMSDWQDFSDNLPASMNIIRLLPFYRDAKLRVAGNRGIWETPMFNTSFKPLAQPAVDKNISTCLRDTFYFEDYSIVKHAGAKWEWSFSPTPQFVSSLTARNPKVVFGKVGSYNVTMTLTDGDGNRVTKTYTNFVSVSDGCGSSPLAGNALELKTATEYANIPALNITTNNMTMMAWIKPNGLQVDYAGILMSATAGGCGFNFMTGNRLGYHWQNNVNTYSFLGGPIVPANIWSHVALSISRDSAVLYLNGVPYKHTIALPTAAAFTSSFNIGNDRANIARTFKGIVDEVSIFNRTLTTNQIREMMHLTRNLTTDSSLVAYYQMNEASGEILDKVGIRHATLVSTASRTRSTAPVGAGTSFRMPVVSAGAKTFTNTGVTLTFPATGNLPNGDVVVTRITNQPDRNPNANPTDANYWVIHNFGTNATVAPLTSLSFEGFGTITAQEAATPALFKLYKRPATADSATWATPVTAATSATAGTNGIVNYANTSNITTFGQFVITKENTTSIKGVKDDIEVLVFPNPIGDNGILTVKTNQNVLWEMVLYDVSGRLVQKEKFIQNGSFSIKNLAKGLYLYQLKSADVMVFDKIVVD
jgi:photosystem II stability/assembly factor-like uncharacterized protein